MGYCGGTTQNPTYQDVCSGKTGHAEAVEVEFDPDQISYLDLLQVFWKIHDPTQGQRQGWNIGDQYRSAVFCQDAAQLQQANSSRQAQQANYRREITTQIALLEKFWLAEAYHQQYYAKKGASACRI